MTYEYVCTACGTEWEAEQAISEAPLTKCPKCKKNTAKRQISGGAGFILKGGGWYADGYGSKKPDAKPSESSGAKSGDKEKPPKKDAGKDSKAKTKGQAAA